MADWKQYVDYFGSPESYAKAIRNKEAGGQSLSDAAAAASFKQARPDLFPIERTVPANFTIQPRAMSPEVSSLVSEVSKLARRAPMTAEDIMASPEWAAQNKVLDLQKGESQAALRRDMASRGMLRSTPAVQSLAGEDARYEAARAQALPQMLNSAFSRQSQGLQNLLSAANTLAGLENTAYNQGLSEFQAMAPYRYETMAGQRQTEQFNRTFPISEAAVTGQYNGQMTPAARQAIAAITGTDPITGEKTWERQYGEQSLANAAMRAGSSGGLTAYQQSQLSKEQDKERKTLIAAHGQQVDKFLKAGDINGAVDYLNKQYARGLIDGDAYNILIGDVAAAEEKLKPAETGYISGGTPDLTDLYMSIVGG